jgi:hypothetical protein
VKNMMRRTVLAVLVLVACGVPLGAWGGEGHRFILDRAIALLPAPIKPVFEKNRLMLLERSVDPDLWRTVGFDEEAPRHFLDYDAYGAFPFTSLPREYGAALAKFGHETIVKNGTLPWHTVEMHGRLLRAFEQQKRQGGGVDTIMVLSAVVSHYIADAHQPMHATLNYDGQLTDQLGLHSRFESELFRRYVSKLVIDPKPLAPIAHPGSAIFDALLSSAQAVPPILKADADAARSRTEYDDGYFEALYGATGPILERRVNEAIAMTAAVITGAWENAGRPDLTLERARTVRKIRGK